MAMAEVDAGGPMWNELPEDILIRVLEQLGDDQAAINRAALVCREWLAATRHVERCVFLREAGTAAAITKHMHALGHSWTAVIPLALTVYQATTVATALATNECGRLHTLRLTDAEPGASEELVRGLRSNTTLRRLDLHCGALADPGARVLREAMATNSTLEHINLYFCMIGDAGALELAAMLGRADCPVRALNLDRNDINYDGALALGAVCSRNNVLCDLSLAFNPLGARGVECIVACLTRPVWRGGHGVTTLSLEGVRFDPSSMRALSEAVAQSQYIRTLNLAYVAQSPLDEAALLGPALAQNTTLESLSLTSTPLPVCAALALAQGIVENGSLRTLNVIQCNIEEKGGRAIGEALTRNRSITRLNIAENNLGGAGEAFGRSLGANAALSVLNLLITMLTEGSLRALFKSLATNASLHTLLLAENSISQGNAGLLAEALHKNGTLTFLNLQSCSLGRHGAALLEGALSRSTVLRNLSLSDNNLLVDGAQVVARVLSANRSLHTLSIEHNRFGSAGGKLLAEGLAQNTTLTRLNVAWNGMDEEVCQRIRAAGGVREDRAGPCMVDVSCNAHHHLATESFLPSD